MYTVLTDTDFDVYPDATVVLDVFDDPAALSALDTGRAREVLGFTPDLLGEFHPFDELGFVADITDLELLEAMAAETEREVAELLGLNVPPQEATVLNLIVVRRLACSATGAKDAA